MLVEQPEQMPLCATAQGLEFLSECQLVCNIPDGIRLSRWEPAGACYDGATIPRWAWSIIGHPFTEEFRFASLIHDEYCKHAKTYEDRRIGDSQFLYLLNLTSIHKSRIPRWKLKAMYLAVRLNSRFLWRPS